MMASKNNRMTPQPLNKQPESQGTRGQSRQMQEEVYEDVNTILKKAIDEIWEMFDDDGNGLFDIDETSSFIKHTLSEMGESPEYAEQDFMQCFQQFTKGGRGYITKPEMMIFIKKVAGFQTKEDEDALVIPEADLDDL